MTVQGRPVKGRPVKVLVNGLHSKSGGGVTYLRNMLPLLAMEADLEVHLCIHVDQRDLLPDHMDGVILHEMSFDPGFWSVLVREQVEIPRLARQIGADVTFSPANYGPFLAPNTVILLRNALSVAFVERRPVKMGYWALLYLATMASLLLSRRSIAVSEYARRSIGAGVLSLLGKRAEVVHHGVDPLFFESDGKTERQDFILAVSDIYVQKNLKNLILTVAKIGAVWPGLRLKIAGRAIDEQYFASLKALVAQKGLENHIEFLGHVAPRDLARLYRRCKIFVFPSTVETFGNPLVEAMACGAPIASSNTAAMSEVAGDAALYFEPSDIGQMADVVDRLLSDAGLRRRLGRKAKERAARFSWPRTARETAEILRQAARR